MKSKLKQQSQWSQSETDELLASVEKCPENLAKVFREHSTKYGRSYSSINGKYYTQLKGKSKLFELKSKSSLRMNTKNIKELPVAGRTDTQVMFKDVLKNQYANMICTLFEKFSPEESLQIINRLL